MSEAEPIIRVRGLVTRFGAQEVHSGIDLDVRRGEILGVVGPSGTGKSVLLREIVGLDQPTDGTIEVFGQNIATMAHDERKSIERRWGVMFQEGALFSTLSLRENVALPLREYTDLSTDLILDLSEQKLAMAGLEQSAFAKRPSQISGGMRKRAAVARALALDPELLFLDEPTSGLDPIGAAAFDELIRDLSDSLDLTVFMITHDLDSLYTITDRVAVLADRKVVAVAPVETLEQSDHPWIQEYFLGPRGRAAGHKHRTLA